jgi:hypothetical protein
VTSTGASRGRSGLVTGAHRLGLALDGELVDFLAADAPLRRDLFGGDALVGEGVWRRSRGNGSRALVMFTPSGTRDIASTPPPMVMSQVPAWIRLAKWMACWAPPHWRSTVVAGVV